MSEKDVLSHFQSEIQFLIFLSFLWKRIIIGQNLMYVGQLSGNVQIG